MSARIVVEESEEGYTIAEVGGGLAVRAALPAEIRVEFAPGEQDAAHAALDAVYSRACRAIEATR